jgi:prepilin-type N-terminal cleavage/methylation domain-containing protein
MTAKKHQTFKMVCTLVRPPPQRRAFTLIELLIVVAIIAILAAIAVPNFLEAQTRAKVSRVKADMRTVATALESYCVDNNKYPPNDENSAVGLGSSPFRTIGGGFMAYAGRITTPIAYLSTAPHDLFDTRTPPIAAAFTADTYGWDLFEYWSDYSPPFPPVTDPPSTFGQLFPGVTAWLLWSWGPDRLSNQGADFGMNTIYDPTNGTISFGNVYRAGPGSNNRASN